MKMVIDKLLIGCFLIYYVCIGVSKGDEDQSTEISVTVPMRILNPKKIGSFSKKSIYKYKTEYLKVPVDHFNFENEDVFDMKYLINAEYWSPESQAPIFFYTGNEGTIESFAENTGFMWETAPEYKALIVFAEHRYYGTSLPYGNKTFTGPQYWGYLTVEQALSDFVDLIEHLRKNQGKKKSPVIAFGGSYGGMLSAWMRMKYPAVITGALAASAPIWGVNGVISDCGYYNDKMTAAYRDAEEHCPTNLRHTWSLLTKFGSTSSGKAWLTTNWKLCTPLKTNDDVQELNDWLQESISDIAMANYPYPADFLGSLPGYPVKKFCQHLAGKNLRGKTLLSSVYRSIKEVNRKAKCLDWTGSSAPDLGYTGWDVQSCEQLILPMCGKGKDQIFPPYSFNLHNYVKYCEKNYKRTPRTNFLAKQYGGKDLSGTSNIIFSNGKLDPWSGGGVLKNLSSTLVAVILPEAAHHLDLRAANKMDPKSVVAARKYYKKTFNKWIKEHKENQ